MKNSFRVISVCSLMAAFATSSWAACPTDDDGWAVNEDTGDLACSPAVNSIGCFDNDDSQDALYEMISDKVDDLLKQASNKAGSIEAFLQKRNFREQIKNFVYSKSGRRPMVIFNISYVGGYSDDEYYGDR